MWGIGMQVMASGKKTHGSDCILRARPAVFSLDPRTSTVRIMLELCMGGK
jgi:hypothetical protein